MKIYDKQELIEYGKKQYKLGGSSASDGYPNDGKWYHKMKNGCVFGDMYQVIRMEAVTSLKEIDLKGKR